MSEVQQYLTPRAVPLRSVSLKPIDDKMPAHHFECPCEMCTLYQHRKGQQQLREMSAIAADKIKERINSSRGNMRAKKMNGHFQWLLRHLLMPTGKICQRAVEITIPETVYYKDGEAFELFLNKQIQEPTVKKIPKEKLGNTLIQKVLGERRKKYRDNIKVKLGVKKVEAKKKNLFGRKQIIKEVKDAVLIRENDGYEYLATQNELLSLLLKRKQDPVWRKILCIKNFINVINYNENSLAVKYSRGKEKYSDLFERAKNLMKVYGKNILPGEDRYISDSDEAKFEKDLKQANKHIFGEYITYKLVSFVEYFYDEQIMKMTAIFLFNELGQIILNQVSRLEVQGLTKFEWTDQVYKRMIDEQEKKLFGKPINQVSQQLEEISGKLEKEMMEEYQKMKDQYGLTVVDEDDHQEIANNTFFKKMHPNFNHNISDVLKDNTLTLDKFKKDYLGQNKERNPLVKNFNSSMIKTIHVLSPRWKRATPHLFIPGPKHATTMDFFNPEESTPVLKNRSRGVSLTSRRLYATLQIQ